MKSIDELIAEFCPDGVEYKPLRELGDFYGGLTGKCKDDFGNGNAKFISYMNVYSNPATNLAVSDMARIGQNEKQNQIQYGDVLFTGSSETPEECAMSSVVTTDITEPIYLNSFCFGFRLFDKSLYHPGFLKHLLRGEATRKQLHKTASGVTRFNVSKQRMASVIIPRPCIEIQREIVRILDGFTGLIDELEAELAARRKQYEQYRDRVLESDIGTYKKVTVSDVCKNICSGGTPTAGNGKFYNGNIPWLRTQEVDWRDIVKTSLTITEEGLSNSSAKWIPANCVIVAMYGATAGKVAINRIPLTTNQACCNLEIDENVAEYKFVFYWLSYRYAQLKKLGQGTQSNINAAIVKKFPINLPSLQEQKRIVETLDKFDALCNDETSGLAAEIAARKTQYEYYRDKLLTFKRKAS